MIKKDINKSLLVLMIFLLVAILSSITFYELKLRQVMGNYNKDRELYNWITANSIVEQLNRTSILKNTALNDKKYLEMKYDELSIQNKKLLNEIENLKSELVIVKSTEEYQKGRDGGPVVQFRLIQAKNAEIEKLKKKINELCLMLKSYNLTAAGC